MRLAKCTFGIFTSCMADESTHKAGSCTMHMVKYTIVIFAAVEMMHQLIKQASYNAYS